MFQTLPCVGSECVPTCDIILRVRRVLRLRCTYGRVRVQVWVHVPRRDITSVFTRVFRQRAVSHTSRIPSPYNIIITIIIYCSNAILLVSYILLSCI